MLYCEKCMLLTNGPKCVRCDGKKLREVRTSDFCFLDEQPLMWAQMLCDVLTQNGVECFLRSVLGAGMGTVLGANLDRQRVFVPYEKLDAAKEIDLELFANQDACAPRYGDA